MPGFTKSQRHIKDNVIKVIFYCEDWYSTVVKINEALKDDALLAYKMNGKTLASEHGYPLRVVLPGKYGMKWAKWINKIELTDKDYKAYHCIGAAVPQQDIKKSV